MIVAIVIGFLLIMGIILSIVALVVALLDNSAPKYPHIKDESFFTMVNSGSRLDIDIKPIDLDNPYISDFEKLFIEA